MAMATITQTEVSVQPPELLIPEGKLATANQIDQSEPLEDPTPTQFTEESVEEIPTSSLPPIDGGKDAYMYLAAAFLVEMTCWGFPVTYGVVLDYYLQAPIGQSPSAKSLLPLVGTLSSGIMYCSAPPITYLLHHFPGLKRWTHWAGAGVCSASLILAAFATKPWHLVLTQGIGYGVGASFVFYVTSNYLPEWFVKKRGMANGVRFAGTAIGGLLFPFCFQAVLNKWGSKVLLLSSGVSVFALLGLFLPFVHGRLPPGEASAHSHEYSSSILNRPQLGNSSIWKNKGLYLFLVATGLQAAAYFTPTLLLPNFARAIHLSASAGSATLVAVNASGLVSRIGLGLLSDRLDPRSLTSLTTLSAALSAFLIWGLAGAASIASLLVFAIVFGVTSGGWTSMWMAIIGELAGDDPTMSNNLFSSFQFVRGLGNIAAAPISSFLLNQPISSISPKLGYGVDGGQWAALILFVGSCLSVVGVEEGLLWIRHSRKRND